MSEEQTNHICADCLKFQKFGKDCHVHWENKKVCTLKVRSEEEWQEQVRMLNTR
jgi:hypothetical protein